MGKFACHCGNVISDSSSPCPWAGELRWEPETDWIDIEASKKVEDFLTAIEGGTKDEWIKRFYGPPAETKIYKLQEGAEPILVETEPFVNDISASEVISDIYTKYSGDKGRSVMQCPECERLYVQKEFYTDDWTCYEKRK